MFMLHSANAAQLTLTHQIAAIRSSRTNTKRAYQFKTARHWYRSLQPRFNNSFDSNNQPKKLIFNKKFSKKKKMTCKLALLKKWSPKRSAPSSGLSKTDVRSRDHYDFHVFLKIFEKLFEGLLKKDNF